ncbi:MULTISPECIES: transposase family protein [unclassified Streptomyces]|uniref:helix-turn-helix domain-containing protein n=1 Tax=unclassified Streptomyces TaxID=2593676 RepID=UPI0033A52319
MTTIRLLATLARLRRAPPHDVLACWFGVGRPAIARAIGAVRPLLAERGRAVADGIRLRTLAEVVDRPGAGGQTGTGDGAGSAPAGPPPAERTGTSSSPARTSRTPSRPWSPPTPPAGRRPRARPVAATTGPNRTFRRPTTDRTSS